MYMLLLIEKVNKTSVDGTHIEWCCACTLEEAIKRARATEKANGNGISVAVVDELYNAYSLGKQYKNLKRLDK